MSEVAAAGGNSTITPHTIEQLLKNNIFDLQRGGTIIINVDDFIEEVSHIIAEHLHEA